MGRLLARAGALGPIAVAAACFSPTPAPGLPCSAEGHCPAGQICNELAPDGPTCEVDPTAVDADVQSADGPSVDAPASTPDAAGPTPDAPIGGLINDKADGAIDVSAGGVFTFDPIGTTDDYAAPCTGAGGRDVFYTITLPTPELIYLDTFGSDFDVVIAITAGACTSAGASEACVDDSCGGADAQGAWNLAAGTHCIIVDGGGPAAIGTFGQLTVVRGGHTGAELTGGAGTVTGNTCPSDDDNSPGCGCGAAEDDHWFFVVCPGISFMADADTCTSPAFDSVLQIRRGTGMSLTCEDSDQCAGGSENVSAPISMKGMYWIVVDGCNACGAYTLTYNF